ncbi:Protein-tyrosine sulfotransferase [Hypsibius exemplaris]|uniref:Protein-tyrosine sulfotransferase n=1 Tax=Hypsibius exemplaris TaxID=2072580 RepID=A0A1W0X522_HYPEX|nr:Protein-tyrosine sulfotransferase [Hypsibius exemplaris]
MKRNQREKQDVASKTVAQQDSSLNTWANRFLYALTIVLCAVGAVGWSALSRNIYGIIQLPEGSNTSTAVASNRNKPMIFIGGMPRSGTTLMRAILDVHSKVRCGEETYVVPIILGVRDSWYQEPTFESELKKWSNGKVTKDVIDSAFAAFLYEIISGHGTAADVMCNKDPMSMHSAHYLSVLFPNAKFIHLVRDGRAVVHSIMSRKLPVANLIITDYVDCLAKWNAANRLMLEQCILVGPSRCMVVYYEQLVLDTAAWLRQICDFLGLQYEDSMLEHEKYIGRLDGVPVSPVEFTSSQVVQQINSKPLSKWVGKVPAEFRQQIQLFAPMLQVLGYNPHVHNVADYEYALNCSPSADSSCNSTAKPSNRATWFEKSKLVFRNRFKPDSVKFSF